MQAVSASVKSVFEKKFGILRLEFKWTVSRGRDTYGYNICSLWVDRQKVSSCMGGGYDMKGTAFAQWLEETFQDALKELFAEQLQTVQEKRFIFSIKDFYGVSLDLENKYVHLHGAAGFNSMEDVAKALGIDLEYSMNSSNANKSVYFASLLSDEIMNGHVKALAEHI